MKDFSVTSKTSHKLSLRDEVYAVKNGKHGIIVGYAGLASRPSYCVAFDGDSGMAESMPFRYASESELSQIPVNVQPKARDLTADLPDFDRDTAVNGVE